MSVMEQWKALGYSKWSDLQHHLEFAIIEALLWERLEVRYISTSESQYPSLPEDETDAQQMLHAARKARSITDIFEWPRRGKDQGFRSYIGKVADAFENFSDQLSLIDDPMDANHQNGFIAADRFVVLAMDNRTYEDYEVNGE